MAVHHSISHFVSQSINQSRARQSVSKSLSCFINQSISCFVSQSVRQSFIMLVSQSGSQLSFSQLVSQFASFSDHSKSISKPVSELSVIQSFNQSAKQLVCCVIKQSVIESQPASQLVNKSISQSLTLLVSQSIGWWVNDDQIVMQSVSQLASLTVYQSVKQTGSQSVNHLITCRYFSSPSNSQSVAISQTDSQPDRYKSIMLPISHKISQILCFFSEGASVADSSFCQKCFPLSASILVQWQKEQR